MKSFAAAVLIGLVFCGAAQASPMPPYAFNALPRMQGYLDRAEAFWADRGGYVNCPGGVQVWWIETPGDPHAGSAAIGGCLIQLYPQQWQAQTGRSARRKCLYILHEYGHLIGLRHEASPNSIMSGAGIPWHPTRRCQFGVGSARAGRP